MSNGLNKIASFFSTLGLVVSEALEGGIAAGGSDALDSRRLEDERAGFERRVGTAETMREQAANREVSHRDRADQAFTKLEGFKQTADQKQTFIEEQLPNLETKNSQISQKQSELSNISSNDPNASARSQQIQTEISNLIRERDKIQRDIDKAKEERGVALIQSADTDINPIAPQGPQILGLPIMELLGVKPVQKAKDGIAFSAVNKANSGYDLLMSARNVDGEVTQLKQTGLALYQTIKGNASGILGEGLTEQIAGGRGLPLGDRSVFRNSNRLSGDIATWKSIKQGVSTIT